MSTKKLQIIGNMGSNVELDSTLSKEGFAADAKAVGDALVTKQPVGDYALKSDIPKLDSYLTEESDPTVPDWAKADTKPSYTASEVGADPTGTASSLVSIHNTTTDSHSDIRSSIEELENTVNDIVIPTKLSELTADSTHRLVTDTEKSTWNAKAEVSDIPTKVSELTNDKGYITSVPVTSVNSKTGAIVLSASDVGADASGTASSAVSSHNTNTSAHNDIRDLISNLTTRLNVLADSDDTTLDQMSEVVAYIKSNKSLIDSITTSKVNVSDIIDNLTTNVSNKPLSAAQGVALKALIDALQTEVNSKADSSSLTSHTGNTTVHITSTERTNWNAAKTHADSAHAPSNAEKNQNAFSNVVVGSTTIAADSTTDSLTLVAGSNVTLTPDATNDKITIAAKDTVYTHPSYTAKTSDLYKVTVDETGHVSSTAAVAKSDITALGIPAQDTTYSAAGSSLGLVKSGGDVTISSGVITVNDDSHNHTIANVDGLQTALDAKSDSGHTHSYAGSSSAGGSANSAEKLATARTISLNGAVSGSASFDGSENVTITTSNGQHISNKNSGTYYYKLGTMVADDSSNFGNITITGRLGGWEQVNSANFEIMMLNRSSARDGNTITATVSASGEVEQALTKCDIVVYRQDDTSEIVYLKLNGYWLYDFDWSVYQHSIDYSATNVTPAGTLVWSLSEAPKTILDTSGNFSVSGTINGYNLDGFMTKVNPTGSGNVSIGRKDGTTTGDQSVVIGTSSTASAASTVAIGYNASATNTYGVAIGASVTASGEQSTAIGTNVKASGKQSTAIGVGCNAAGEYAFATGCWTNSNGVAGNSLGNGSTVDTNSWGAMASGIVTTARGLGQHVFGSYNIPDDAVADYSTPAEHLMIVGNGDVLSENGVQSNAMTLDWGGNAWFSGDVYVGSTSGTNKDSGSKKLATQDMGMHFIPADDFTVTAGSSTSGSYLATKWVVADVDGITVPTNGMAISVRTPAVGYSGGILLSIDGGTTYYPIVRNVNSLVTTNYGAGSTLMLVFNSTQTASPYLTAATKTEVTGCWQIADYDENTKTSSGTSNKVGTKLFLVGGTSQSSSGVTTYSNKDIYINTSNVLYSANGFSGDVTGNATSATKATQDASGNVITDTYATKTEIVTQVESALSEAKASGDFKGDKGDTGNTGADGVSISSVKQTTTSTADDGNNIITVTLSNGATSTFTIQNGSKGSTGVAGSNGSDGYTPVRGTDYWTAADKAEIKSYVDEAILGGEW